MSEPFIGEIRMFAGNFAPSSWAFCDGQLLSVSQNDALFSLLGTLYGGDGRTTYGLPDLRGRIPVHSGQSVGVGLTLRRLGEKGGSETETLSPSHLPPHSHLLHASNNTASDNSPVGNVTATEAANPIYGSNAPSRVLKSDATTETGASLGHDNLMPFLCVNFIIALFGILPSQS